MDEIVDIVNEQDVVIGKETKDFCHANHLLHRGTMVLCFKDNSFRELLLTKRSLTKKANPGKICAPGGHVDAGETYLEGAKREFGEEMFDNQTEQNFQMEELFKIKKDVDNDYEFITVFRTIHPGPFNIDKVEVDSWYFEDIEMVCKKVKELPEEFTGTTRLVLKKV